MPLLRRRERRYALAPVPCLACGVALLESDRVAGRCSRCGARSPFHAHDSSRALSQAQVEGTTNGLAVTEPSQQAFLERPVDNRPGKVDLQQQVDLAARDMALLQTELRMTRELLHEVRTHRDTLAWQYETLVKQLQHTSEERSQLMQFVTYILGKIHVQATSELLVVDPSQTPSSSDDLSEHLESGS